MIVDSHSIFELKYYLKSVLSSIEKLPLDKPIYKEGTTIGQIAFHIGESANFYLKIFLLEQTYTRNREAEFRQNHTFIDIKETLEKALQACEEVINKQISFNQKIKKKKKINSVGFELQTVYEVLQHVTAHTAEHFGQINTTH